MEDISRFTYRYIALLALLLLAVGTVFYHFVEKLSWLDAYYFSVVTLATVGYGDITPVTIAGKIFTTFYILAGVGVIAAFVSERLHYRSQRFGQRRKQGESKKNGL